MGYKYNTIITLLLPFFHSLLAKGRVKVTMGFIYLGSGR